METQTLSYPRGTGKAPWLAQITGPSEKFSFELGFAFRTFGGNEVHFQLPASKGLFELGVDSYRAFFAVQGRRFKLLTKAEVQSHLTRDSLPPIMARGWTPLSLFVDSVRDHFEMLRLRYEV